MPQESPEQQAGNEEKGEGQHHERDTEVARITLVLATRAIGRAADHVLDASERPVTFTGMPAFTGHQLDECLKERTPRDREENARKEDESYCTAHEDDVVCHRGIVLTPVLGILQAAPRTGDIQTAADQPLGMAG